MRTVEAIESEWRAKVQEANKARGIAAALKAELDEARECRDLRVLADFDAGMPRADLLEKHGLKKQTLANILHDNKRRYRDKIVPISHLPAEQQRAYFKAKRCGMGPSAARSYAEQVQA